MKLVLALAITCVLVVSCPSATEAQNAPNTRNRGLTVEDVVNLLQHGVPPEQVVELIQRNPSSFAISLDTIDNLRKAGVGGSVIDAMLKARAAGPVPTGNNPPTPTQINVGDVPSPNIHPTPANPVSVTPKNGKASVTATAGGDSGSQVPPNSAPRFQLAKTAKIPGDSWTPPGKQADPGCPLNTHGKVHRVDLDFDSGSSSASRLGGTGMYCFALRKANPLYDWSIMLNVAEPTGNPFDLLNDAIQTLTKLSTGASTTKPAPSPTPGATRACNVNLSGVTDKATALRQKLAAMVPTKDSNSKITYVPFDKTQTDWPSVPSAFNDFEQAVKNLQGSLPDSWDAQDCDTLLAQAESVILDDYPKLRTQYRDLSARLSKSGVEHFERPLEGTMTADLVATPSYSGTAAGSKTYHFDPSFGILSSSAGFLLTQLPARAYSSTTAPDPNDSTKTQNVLKVDYGAGIRPALVVLLTGNVPQVNTRNFGLGVSGGPVFDISNGKADTSRFGFFGGISLRLTPWIYLTPGVHVGEFADFPQGFTHPGQVIPPNMGTPTPTKRYTARFAFALTFKIKDLGASTATDQTKTKQSSSSAQSSAAAAGAKQ